jgi:translation initiation factor 2B subunit (eIF-2B alpha/beta/delta family)
MSQRDDDHSDKLKPDTESGYYKKEIKETELKIKKMKAMTSEQIVKAHALALKDAKKRRESAEKKRLNELAKYNQMLSDVSAWQPPTADHEGLKKFMVDQINQSIDFDCKPYNFYESDVNALEAVTHKQWHKNELEKLQKELSRIAKSREEDLQRIAGRNKWKEQLCKSLGLPWPL